MCPYYLDGDQARHCISAELGDNHCDVTTVQFSRAAGRRPAGFAGRSLKTQQHAGREARELRTCDYPTDFVRGHRQVRSTLLGPAGSSSHGMRLRRPDRRSNPGDFPRKEVIQPHLPVRLPCYDFTPVTSPTFDGSLPEGLGHRLRVLLTPVV